MRCPGLFGAGAVDHREDVPSVLVCFGIRERSGRRGLASKSAGGDLGLRILPAATRVS
jgi:hypothetical protein